jgi:hypothetical protein
MKLTTCGLCDCARSEKTHLRLCDDHLTAYRREQWARRKERIKSARKPKQHQKPPQAFRRVQAVEVQPVLNIRPTKPVRPVQYHEPERFQLQLERSAYIQARLNRF